MPSGFAPSLVMSKDPPGPDVAPAFSSFFSASLPFAYAALTTNNRKKTLIATFLNAILAVQAP